MSAMALQLFVAGLKASPLLNMEAKGPIKALLPPTMYSVPFKVATPGEKRVVCILLLPISQIPAAGAGVGAALQLLSEQDVQLHADHKSTHLASGQTPMFHFWHERVAQHHRLTFCTFATHEAQSVGGVGVSAPPWAGEPRNNKSPNIFAAVQKNFLSTVLRREDEAKEKGRQREKHCAA
jgi:hypothetical protein